MSFTIRQGFTLRHAHPPPLLGSSLAEIANKYIFILTFNLRPYQEGIVRCAGTTRLVSEKENQGMR